MTATVGEKGLSSTMKPQTRKASNISLKFIVTAVLAVLSAFLLANTAAAFTIGASPASIQFPQVLRSGYAEFPVTVSTNADEVVFGHVEATGDISSWISFIPNSTSFNATINKPTTILAVVQPPPDVQIGSYEGKLTIVGDDTGDISGRAGSVVKISVILPMKVTVTGEQVLSCTTGAFEFEDAEEGLPLVFWATVKNTGNVRLNPPIKLSIWDSSQGKVIMTKELQGKLVLPTRTERFSVATSQNLGVGQYWADVSIPQCSAQQLLTFSIIEKGGIADKGELTEIVVPAKVTVGDTAPVTAIFYNSGKNTVIAQLKGTAKKDGKVAGLISSDQIEVEPGKVEKLVAYFIPTEPGKYSVTGRVNYNNKLTFEKSASFTAEARQSKTPESIFQSFFSPLIIYIILIVTALFIIKKINNRKRRPF